jgi:hypothetical protein
MAATLWAAVAQAQLLPSSGPGSKIAVGQDDTPLIRPALHHLRAVGLAAGAPGPFLPHPCDPVQPLAPDSGPQ